MTTHHKELEYALAALAGEGDVRTPEGRQDWNIRVRPRVKRLAKAIHTMCEQQQHDIPDLTPAQKTVLLKLLAKHLWRRHIAGEKDAAAIVTWLRAHGVDPFE